MNFKRGILRLVAETEKTQTQLGREAEIASTTITSWSVGRVEPKISLIEKLLAPQDVKVATFISWCEE